MAKSIFSSIQYINELLSSPRIKPYMDRLHPAAVMATMRGVIDDISGEMKSVASEWRLPDVPDLVEKIVARLQIVVETGPSLTLDAQGYLFVSGRRELPLPAIEEMIWSFDASTDLDEAMVSSLICRMTGAEDAILFSGPGQAEMAVYRTFGQRHRPILLARRDLCENEDGTRTESLFRNMGVRIEEVGCANKVTLADYRAGFSKRMGLVRLALPCSDDGISFDSGTKSGVTKDSLKDALSELKEALEPYEVPLHIHVDYVSLIPLETGFSRAIPVLSKIVEIGPDLITCSTSQLIGGPACGLVLGKKTWMARIRQSGSDRMFPPHYADLAGVYRTFSLSQNIEEATLKIPILQKVTTSMANLRNRGARLVGQLQPLPVFDEVTLEEGESRLARNAKDVTVPSCLLRLVPAKKMAEQFALVLAKGNPSILAQVREGALLLDLRTMSPKYDPLVTDLFAGLPVPTTP